jgi:threonine/homoserine/homoserine lactone efflux protein
MPVAAVAAFWAVSFLFVITPGTDWAYAITAGLRHRTVLPAVSGLLGLNPKVFLLFLALLPQFIVAGAPWPLAAQIVVLGLVHVTSCAVVYTGVGTGARRVLRARPAAARVVSRLSGTAMIVLGVVFLAEQLVS